MTFIESFKNELEREAITTRKMLEKIPDGKYDWKPHEKSMTVQQLATHVAEIPTWINMVLNSDELDFANNSYQPVTVSNTADLLTFFEKSLADGRNVLSNSTDDKLKGVWTMRNGEEIYASNPKDRVLREVFCQVVHHRAQLGVYLRLLDIPIPGSYGPSADDQGF